MIRRILIVHNAPPAMGGAEASLCDFLSFARDNREYCFVVACSAGSRFAKEVRALGIQVLPTRLFMPTRPRSLWAMLLVMLRVLLANASIGRLIVQQRPHVLHANNTSSFLQSALAAKFAGVPTVWHVRDATQLPRGLRFLERWASMIVCISKDVAKRVLVCPNRSVIIYNGLRLTQLPTPAKRHPDTNDLAQLITVSQFVPWKRHSVVIDVVAELRRRGFAVRAILVGAQHHTSDAPYLEGLMQKARQLGLAEQVRFVACTERIQELISNSTVLLHPAINEPMGRVIAEAMLLQTPVVASRSGGISEFLESGREGMLVEPDDVQGFANAVLRVLNPDLAGRLVAKARERALSVFDIEHQSRKLMQVYDRAFYVHQSKRRLIHGFSSPRQTADSQCD